MLKRNITIDWSVMKGVRD